MRRERRSWNASLRAAGPRPVDRLLAVALAHARYGRRHPQLHALAFGPYVAKADYDELQQEAIENFALLRSLVGACLGDDAPMARQRACSVVVWATVRGLVDLSTHRQIPASVESSVDDMIVDAITSLVSGWAKPPTRDRRRSA